MNGTDVHCPTCGADQGEHCYTVAGRPMYDSVHRDRRVRSNRAARRRATQPVLPLGFEV